MQTLPSVDFCTAVKSGFQNFAICSGRARRSEFWYFYLFLYLVLFAFIVLFSTLTSNSVTYEYDSYTGTYRYNYSSGYYLFTIVFYVVFIFFEIPLISLAVRRLHDTGRSGFYFFVVFIPLVGGIILLYFFCLDSEEMPNEYGPSPKYILPLNQPINPVSPYPQQAPVSPYPQPMAQPVSPYPQPNPVPPQPYMAPPPGPYPQQYPTQGNLYPQ